MGLTATVLFCFAPGVFADGVVELAAGFHRIEAEVASTYPERARGLMHRRDMAERRGMLFVFPRTQVHCMWMRDTFIALSVAFMDEQGTIINIADMQPQSDATHCAAAPARYALEMNRGWFAQRGIKPGARIGGLEMAPAPR